MRARAKRFLIVFGAAVVVVVLWFALRGRNVTRQPDPGVGQGTATPISKYGSDASVAAPVWPGSRGAPARRVAGRVTADGKAVSNAVVTLNGVLAEVAGVPPLQQVTGVTGAFDFGTQSSGTYKVTARAADRMSASLSVDLADPLLEPPADRLEIRLQSCGAMLTGTVADAAGAPIPGAYANGWGLAREFTNDDGEYQICVPLGQTRFEYGADGYGSLLLTVDVDGPTRRDVTLAPAATLTVEVVRADDGTAVVGAVVAAYPAEMGIDQAKTGSAVSGSDGRAHIDGLVPGRYFVNGHGEGLQSTADVEVTAGVGISTVTVLRLAATARIRGLVTLNGKPVAGARVAAERANPRARSWPSRSQLDGSFALELVPLGEVSFLAAPYEVVSPARLDVAARDYADVVLEVRPLAAILGRVTRHGQAVEGASVCCVKTVGAFTTDTKTDAMGRYRFAGVLPGTYEVVATSMALGARGRPISVVVNGSEDHPVDHELDVAGSIAGLVVDQAGSPVAGVHVSWTGEDGDRANCATDDRGRYRCRGLRGAGTYRAAVYPTRARTLAYRTADGGAYPAREVKDGATDIDGVQLAIERQQLTISGRVVDDRGAGVADARVRATPGGGGGAPAFHGWDPLPTAMSDADGAFVIRRLGPGMYALQARAPDGSEVVAPAVAAGSAEVVLELIPATRIEGELVGFREAPIVTARRSGAATFAVGSVSGATFTINDLQPGTYLIAAQSPRDGAAAMVEVAAGRTSQLRLSGKGNGALIGVVRDFHSGAPLEGVPCHAVMSVAGQVSIAAWDAATAPRSDAAGRVALDPAPAGNVSIECSMPSLVRSAPSAETLLAEGERRELELRSVQRMSSTPGTIGVDFIPGSTTPRVARVEADGPAAKAGLVEGDLITKVDDKSVEGLNAAGVATLIANASAGSAMSVTVERAAGPMTVSVDVQSGAP